MMPEPRETNLIGFRLRGEGADRARVARLLEAEILTTRLSAIRRALVVALALAGAAAPIAVLAGAWHDTRLMRSAAGTWVLVAAATTVVWIAERVWYRRRNEIADELSRVPPS